MCREPGAARELSIRPAGDRALLVSPGEHDRLAGVVAALRAGLPVGVEDFLPAAETVLVTVSRGADLAAIERDLWARLAVAPAPTPHPAADAGEVVIPVRYDGRDLAEVAGLLGLSVAEVIAEHTGRIWRCRFIGFAAGFGYLESAGTRLAVPRRARPRTAVPGGAVALADGYSAVYPRRGPGGWQLIGTTDLALWDLDRPNPALLSVGTAVRFVDRDRG